MRDSRVHWWWSREKSASASKTLNVQTEVDLSTYDSFQATYNALSDLEITELLESGRDAFKVEAWQALLSEAERRGLRLPTSEPLRPSTFTELKQAIESLPDGSLETLLRDEQVRRVVSRPLDAAAEGLARTAAPLAEPDTYRQLGRRALRAAGLAVGLTVAWSIRETLKGHALRASDYPFLYLAAWAVLFVIPLVGRWARSRELF